MWWTAAIIAAAIMAALMIVALMMVPMTMGVAIIVAGDVNRGGKGGLP